MMNTAESLRSRIAKIPMAMVVVPFALGIFVVDGYSFPLWLLISALAISITGVILLKKWWQYLALLVALMTTGGLIHSLSFRGEIPYNTPLEMSIAIEHSSVNRKGYTSTEAKIEECEDATLAGRKIVLWGDSLIHLKAGDRLHLKTPIHPFRAEREKYAELMYHRGFIGSIALTHRGTYEYIPTVGNTLHDWAVERLKGAMNEGDGRAVVLAMTTGERGEIKESLRQNYSASGASHLLAVSGLHIGIAFMLINILLLPLVLLRHGNVVRSVVAITLIWLYVWLCGMSPSAVRAAIMFSLLQFSLSSLREYVSMNILAGTAFAMLALDSHLLFDISFQLSFIAVAGIILWAMPIYRLCATRFKAINFLLGILLVGVASTLATMPLVSNSFATVSVVGVLINPVVVLLANIIVLTGVVALAIPPIGFVAEGVAEWQNGIIEWASSLPYSHFDFSISEGAMWGIYAVYTIVTILIFSIPRKKKEVKIE